MPGRTVLTNDSGAVQVLGQRGGEVEQRSLGRRVIRHVRERIHRLAGPDLHDPSPASCAHGRQETLDAPDHAITLLAEGNADIYSREGIVCIPVSGLEPARLAIAWRRSDRRLAIQDFVQACREAADPHG